MSNSTGTIFRLTSFGESHGKAIGGVIDGVPAGLPLSTQFIQNQLDRRRPGQSSITTQRKESDTVTILSGVMDGVTTGTPIGFIVPNDDQHSNDYEEMRTAFRPSHADYTYTQKYGLRDHRGGGRSSARETIARVVAGAVAMQALSHYGISIKAYTSSVGDTRLDASPMSLDLSAIDSNDVRCPDAATAARMHELITEVRNQGDTIGGTVTCVITGCPAGIGEPAFDKFHARLASAMMSINAAKGFEYGMGFEGCARRGSETIDEFFIAPDGSVDVRTNNSGGIQGGISNGAPIIFRVAFKPVATLLREVHTIDIHGNETVLKARGRHDPCVLPRAVPIVEAMAAITVLDLLLLGRASRL